MNNAILGLLIFAALLGGFSIYWIVKLRRERFRTTGIANLAQRLGLNLSDELSAEDSFVFKRFPIAQAGNIQSISNVVLADNGEVRIVVFDFTITTIKINSALWTELTSSKSQKRKYRGAIPERKRKSRKHRHLSVALAISSSAQWPDYSCERESWWTLFDRAKNSADIDFEEDPVFSKTFLVLSSAPDQTREFLTPSRRELLLSDVKRSLGVHSNAFVAVRQGRKLTADSLQSIMQDALALHQAFIVRSSSTTN